MHVKNTYPKVTKLSKSRKGMLSIIRWPFFAAAAAALIVNLCVKGPFWSIIVILGLYMVWTFALSPDLVEFNRISQTIKITVWSSILLVVIDRLFVLNFSLFVVPIVCFSGLSSCIVLFFTNLETQKHNMLPLINFIFVSIIASLITLHFHHGKNSWPLIVLLSLSALSLIAFIIVLGPDFKREMQRRFHIK